MLLNMKSKSIVRKSCIEHYEQIINSKENVKAFNKTNRWQIFVTFVIVMI